MNISFIMVVMVIIICFVLCNLFTSEHVNKMDDIEDDENGNSIGQLISDLYAIRVITGLSFHEKEVIDKAIDYIEKAESIKNEGN